MSSIKEFWNNKELYINKDVLLQNIKEAYTQDFIDNFNKWKSDLDELNSLILENLSKSKIDIKYFLEISFNDFCSYIINEIENFINLNNDIDINDVSTILNNLITTQFNKIFDNYQSNKYTLSNILESIKKINF